MTSDKSKTLIQQGIFTVVISVFTAFMVRSMDKNDQAAPRDYVDKQLEQVHMELKGKADRTDVTEIKNTITVMDGRVYDIWKALNNPKVNK